MYINLNFAKTGNFSVYEFSQCRISDSKDSKKPF